MADIVERLLDLDEKTANPPFWTTGICGEAADELDRLRAEAATMRWVLAECLKTLNDCEASIIEHEVPGPIIEYVRESRAAVQTVLADNPSPVTDEIQAAYARGIADASQAECIALQNRMDEQVTAWRAEWMAAENKLAEPDALPLPAAPEDETK